MHCGEHEEVKVGEFKPVGLWHLLDGDESLSELGAFPENHYAIRAAVGSPWVFIAE